jgi:hypothetical protein
VGLPAGLGLRRGCDHSAKGDQQALARLRPKFAVAFTCMGIAVMVILLITLFGHLF